MVMNPISLPGFLVKGVMTILYIATFEHGTCGITWCTTEGFQRIDDSMTAFRRNDEFPVRIFQISAKLITFLSLAQVACGPRASKIPKPRKPKRFPRESMRFSHFTRVQWIKNVYICWMLATSCWKHQATPTNFVHDIFFAASRISIVCSWFQFTQDLSPKQITTSKDSRSKPHESCSSSEEEEEDDSTHWP